MLLKFNAYRIFMLDKDSIFSVFLVWIQAILG